MRFFGYLNTLIVLFCGAMAFGDAAQVATLPRPSTSAASQQECKALLTRVMGFFDKNETQRNVPQYAKTREQVLDYKNGEIDLDLAPRHFTEAELFVAHDKELHPKRSKDCVICDGNLSDSMARIETITSLRRGDSILLENGETIVLGEFLGSGDSTHIFAVEGSPAKAIRIPRASTTHLRYRIAFYRWDKTFRRHYFFVQSSKKGAEWNMPLVKTFYLSSNLAVVERINPYETAEAFAKTLKQKGILTGEDREKLHALGTFLLGFRGKPSLVGVAPGQIVWVDQPGRRGWVGTDYDAFGQFVPPPDKWHKVYESTFQSIWDLFGKNWDVISETVGPVKFVEEPPDNSKIPIPSGLYGNFD